MENKNNMAEIKVIWGLDGVEETWEGWKQEDEFADQRKHDQEEAEQNGKNNA